MTAFLVKRLLTLGLTLAVASVLIFAVLDVLPGDAAVLRLGETATPEAIEALQRQLGLDQPAWQRYLAWIGQALQGQTARSVSYDTHG